MTIFAGAALLVCAGPALSASAEKLSWFDETPFAGVGVLDVPEVRLRNPAEYNKFGLKLYRAEMQDSEVDDTANSEDNTRGRSSLSIYGEVETPANRPRYSSLDHVMRSSANRVNAFGVKWQHVLDSVNSFAVSAEYGEGTAVLPMPLETQDARAAFSWTSRLPISLKPSITGSVFLGDEVAREEIYRHLGRKYYGFSVGGSMTLLQSHTPYVSFKMQKSLYDANEDTQFVATRSSDRSLLSAGWKWQVQRDFSLQAEASYGVGTATTTLDPNKLEHSRILFGTRFDFK